MVSRNGRSGYVAAGVMLALVAVLFAPAPATAVPHSTTRVSVARDGTQTNAFSGGPSISANGRYIAFNSQATNVVAGDTNDVQDVFVRDNLMGTNSRVSVTSSGAQLPASSEVSDVSAEGRYVVFETKAIASAEDTDDDNDVYVHDRRTRSTTLVTVPQNGASSADGDSVTSAAISADGRYVAFDSDATDLAPGDDNESGQNHDVFVRDRQAGTTTRVSVFTVQGQEIEGAGVGPDISGDGRYVVFVSGGTGSPGGDLTSGNDDIVVQDRQTGSTTRVVGPGDGSMDAPAISADGTHVAFTVLPPRSNVPGAPSPVRQIYVHNRQTGANTLASAATAGTAGDGDSNWPTLNADGRYVAFASDASNLVAGDTNNWRDIFIRDVQSATTTRVSVASDGTQATQPSNLEPGVSADGRYVAYQSSASNLVPGDLNNVSDVFLYDKLGSVAPPPPPKPLTVSVGNVSVAEGDQGSRPAIFTVSLSRPAASTVTVSYATANGTAVKAQPAPDYKATSGTLSFAPGTTALQVKVPVLGDAVDEPFESFSLNLSNPAGAKLGDTYGIGTIIDDEPQAVTGGGVAIGDVAVYEGDDGARNAVFTVSLAQARSTAVTVSYATANGAATSPADYTARSGTLSFAPGVISAQVKVPITPDAVRETLTKTFTVNLSAATGAPIARSTGTGTVIDDD